WYLPHSRDNQPHTGTLHRLRDALAAAGHDTELDIDTTPRTTAEIEADRLTRATNRATALDNKATRHEHAADAAHARHAHDLDRLPPAGEPIKIGHHSEARHRRDLTRAHTSMTRTIDATNRAEYTRQKATTAAHTTQRRYNPTTVANRITALAADIRKIEREIVADVYDDEIGYRPATDEQKRIRGERYAPHLHEKRDQLAYWEQVRADQITTGIATGYTREDINAGDAIKTRGHWRRVARVNAKTVSVETGYSWTDRVPYPDIQEHRPASAIAPSMES
ncbi:DUF3560 domain-containing protein, partial [Mycetocola reblochoni]|uniref:DUF3560 domain-containing protein n=1 Tax=Mycetocola reblochoni TaxID=331618 RepID=UPI003F990A47